VRTPKSTPGPTVSDHKTHAFGIADKTHGFAVADPPAGDTCPGYISWVYDSCGPPGQPLDRRSAWLAIFVGYG